MYRPDKIINSADVFRSFLVDDDKTTTNNGYIQVVVGNYHDGLPLDIIKNCFNIYCVFPLLHVCCIRGNFHSMRFCRYLALSESVLRNELRGNPLTRKEGWRAGRKFLPVDPIRGQQSTKRVREVNV